MTEKDISWVEIATFKVALACAVIARAAANIVVGLLAVLVPSGFMLLIAHLANKFPEARAVFFYLVVAGMAAFLFHEFGAALVRWWRYKP